MNSPFHKMLAWIQGPPAQDASGSGATVTRADRSAQAFARLGSLPLDLPTLSDVVLSSVRRLVPCDLAELLLIDGDAFGTVDAGVSRNLRDWPALRLAVAQAEAKRSRPLTRSERSHFGERVRMITYIPVGARGAIVAVVALGWRSPRLAAASTLDPVADYCAALAPAISAALVHQRALVAEADAMTLVEAVSALARTQTVESVADTTCLYARRVAHARRARFAVIEGEDLAIIAANPSRHHPAQAGDPSASLMLHAAQTGTCGEERTPARTSLAVPVAVGGAALGVLQFDFSPSPAGVTERARSLCEAVAAHAGVALARAQETNELAYQASTDALTGLANRRRLDADLLRELSRAGRSGEPLAVAMVDMDHFKSYNDEHGHLEGDLLLASFGRYLNAQVRAMDVVGRYGGEEFMLVLPNTTAREAEAVAVRLLRAWRSETNATFSAGVAAWAAGEDPETLVGRADRALYSAKANGRDSVRVAPEPGGGDEAGPAPADDGAARIVPLRGAGRRRGA